MYLFQHLQGELSKTEKSTRELQAQKAETEENLSSIEEEVSL